MNTLSCFNGYSAGRLALQRAGIPVTTYSVSEIDRYANTVAQKNYPDTQFLGSVTNWRKWNIPTPDILMGGSPCQGFSQAGGRLNFEDPRSKLFFEFVDILNHYQPRYFMLENVVMKQEWADVITSYLGVEPIVIDSARVSGQRRKRMYWTNIAGVDQPAEKGIQLADVLLPDPDPRLTLSFKELAYMDRRVRDGRNHWDFGHHSSIRHTKASTLTANLQKGVPYNVVYDGAHYRKFDPIECERLQTLPDNWTAGVSRTQRYKMLGNGWTVDVVAHIFSKVEVK